MEIFYVLQENEYTEKNKLRTVLLAFQKVCFKTDSTCFACCGTLLGAVRHGDIIWHDDDIDMGIFEEDVVKIDKFCRGSSDWGWRKSKTLPDSSLWIFFHRATGSEIDVFIHRKYVSNNSKVKYMLFGESYKLWPQEYFDSPPSACTYKLGKLDTRNIVFQNSLQFFEDCTESEPPTGFLDIYVKGPDNVEKYLERAYGKDWHVPRTTHFHSVVSFRNSVFYFVFLIMALVCFSVVTCILCFTECFF